MIGKAASLMLQQKRKVRPTSRLSKWERECLAESRGEVDLSASILKYYADNAETFLAPRPLNSIAGEAYIEYSPLGVLIGVQPWNYPYYQLARFAAPHLTSGNVMLVKHAPGVPQCALAFEQLFVEAGAPAGVYTNVFLSNDQVAMLIDDPRTRGVALTGSERAGRISGISRGEESEKVDDGARGQRRIYRAGGLRPGGRSEDGRRRSNRQHWTNLHRREAIHLCRI